MTAPYDPSDPKPAFLAMSHGEAELLAVLHDAACQLAMLGVSRQPPDVQVRLAQLLDLPAAVTRIEIKVFEQYTVRATVEPPGHEPIEVFSLETERKIDKPRMN